MEGHLDQYLRAEIAKQMKGWVIVVLDRNEADGILAGITDRETGTAAKITGRYLGLHDTATGTVSLLDRQGKNILWSDEPAIGTCSSAWRIGAESERSRIA